jgi:two-component system sensor histidine kinase CpxA
MRSLFLKIFLTFWATLLLIAMAFALMFWLRMDNPEPRLRAGAAAAANVFGGAAVEEFERHNTEALEKYLTRIRENTRLNASLYTADGRLLGGEATAPPDLLAQALESGRARIRPRGQGAFIAIRVAGSAGASYIFVAETGRRPPPPPPFFRGVPDTMRWAIAITISGLICFALARYMTSPILRLRAATRALASGNLQARAESTRRSDEIGDLVRDFNVMAGRLESLVNSQNRLIRDISHELRSPLTRLGVALELARGQAGDAAAASLDRIEQESEQLNTMIGNLLTLARLETESSAPKRDVVRLDELLKTVCDDAQFEAQAHDSDVNLVHCDQITLSGDASLLRSAIENVVRNAVNYTHPGTAVEVSLKAEPALARITVCDRGPGVPPQDVQRIFEPFYRTAVARERTTGGTGLGLAITRRAVLSHGGEVSASNRDGGGLCVMITIPAAQPVTAAI